MFQLSLERGFAVKTLIESISMYQNQAFSHVVANEQQHDIFLHVNVLSVWLFSDDKYMMNFIHTSTTFEFELSDRYAC